MLGKLVFCKSSTKSYSSKTELVLGIWNRGSIPKKIRETASKRKVKCLV